MAEPRTSELETLVREFLTRAQASDPAVETRADLAPVISRLDNLWWDRITDLTAQVAREQQDRLIFTKYDRMLIDLGILDLRLAPGGEQQRVAMLRELYEPAPPNFFYLSEWLAHRYRDFMLHGRLQRDKNSEIANETLSTLKEARRRIYRSLAPLVQNVPGLTPQMTELFLEGRLDDLILELTAQLARGEDLRAAEQRKQLLAIRTKLLSHARERASNREQLSLFDALGKLDRMADDRAATLQATKRVETSIPPAERITFIRGEIKLVRSLLKLGITGSGITRSHSVLLSSRRRMTKGEIGRVLARVKEVDPHLPVDANLLIAPYVGTGFYEWDRDTVFVPLLSTRDEEDSIVTALANYRLMLDNLQDRGRLRRAWEAKFGRREDFRAAFLREYKAWVVGVGKGFRGAMSDEAYEFFKHHIGPQEQDLWAPVEYARLTPEEHESVIRSCRQKIASAEATWLEHYRLAICHWRDDHKGEALKEIAQAVKLNPVDGRLLFTLGGVCHAMKLLDKARQALEECVAMAPNTLWHLYSLDLLREL